MGCTLVLALLVRLDAAPPVWWDEGWTLSVARNWVELGHYGRLLDGQPAPRGLEASFPVTASIALAFHLFGVGIYQARLVAVVFTLATLVLMYELTRSFYNRSIALATLIVVIVMSGRGDMNPLIVGRQVLAEIPMLFFLLAGYLCFLVAEKRAFVFIPASICFWSVALVAKAQSFPFWVLALALPLLCTLVRQQWRSARLFGAAFVGTLALYQCLQYLFALFAPSPPVSGLAEIVALVLVKETRVSTLIETFQFGMPTLLGLCWGLRNFLRSESKLQSHLDLVRFSFLVLAGSWFGWFVFLSIGYARYMFPPVFLSAVFVAVMLDEWTNHFDVEYMREQSVSVLQKLQFHWHKLSAFAATVLIALSLGQSLGGFYGAFVLASDNSIHDTIRFLNTVTPPNALIETFESELLFLLDRRYHYPPDQVHVELIRRLTFDYRLKIDYDPLAANPDYLVVGHQSKYMGLYDPYLNTGAFRLVKKFSRYDIYERVR